MTGPPLYLPAVWANDFALLTPAGFLYRPAFGAVSLLTPQVPVFTRTGSGATSQDALGRVYTTPHSLARTTLVDTDGDLVRDTTALRLDPTALNIAKRSDSLGTAGTWVPANAPSITRTPSLGGLTLAELLDDSATLVESYTQNAGNALTATVATLSFFVAKPASASVAASGSRVRVLDGANVRASVTMTWSGTSLTTSAVTGTLLAKTYEGLNSDGMPTYRVQLRTTTITPANAHSIELLMAVTAGQTGSVVLGGFQLENGECATSYIPTAGSNVTRNAETWYAPWGAEPREATVMLDFIERGAVGLSGTPSLFLLSDSGGGTPLWDIETTGTVYRTRHHNGSAAVTSNATVAPGVGDRVRLRSVLRATGAVQTYQSINGGAEVAGAASAANALASAWAGTFTGTRIALSGPVDLLGAVVLFGERSETDCAGYL